MTEINVYNKQKRLRTSIGVSLEDKLSPIKRWRSIADKERIENYKVLTDLFKGKHLKEKYHFCGPTFATEKLAEIHDIQLGKETVRGIMTNIGLWQPKTRKQSKKRHVWRARKDNYGEMPQFDGSFPLDVPSL